MHSRVPILFTVLLAGCGDFSGLGGTSEFACKAPAGVHCDSLSGTYYNSLANNLPSQRQHAAKPMAPESDVLPRSAPNVATQPDPGFAPGALRQWGREMRVWIKAWQDDDHDLADQSYVYLVVSDGAWRVAHVQRQERVASVHLAAQAASPAEPESATSLAPASGAEVPAPAAPTARAGEAVGKQ